MDTITIPAADYTQRADDEGRDYHAYRTIAAAAEKWADRVDRAWTITDPDEDSHLIFSHIVDRAVTITTCSADEDMEGLYAADDLPFKIATPVTFKVGDYIARKNHASKAKRMIFRVTDLLPAHGLRVTYMRSNQHVNAGATGVVAASDLENYELCDAPTVTYTVTVRGDHTADDLIDMLSNLGGPVTVEAAE